jgi:hypothetical protein
VWMRAITWRDQYGHNYHFRKGAVSILMQHLDANQAHLGPPKGVWRAQGSTAQAEAA